MYIESELKIGCQYAQGAEKSDEGTEEAVDVESLARVDVVHGCHDTQALASGQLNRHCSIRRGRGVRNFFCG